MKRYCLWKIAVIISVLLLPTLASSQGTYKFERMWPFQPWYFNTPVDIAWSDTEEDNVYVLDSENCLVRKYTRDGKEITSWGGYGTGDGEFDNPQGIGVDPAGTVYVVDTGNHRIQKFSSDGILIGWWGKDDLSFTGWHDPGSGRTGVFGSGDGEFNNPYGITFLGSVFVADTGNHRIQKFDYNGDFRKKWGIEGTAGGAFNSPQGIAAGRDPYYIYVADTGNHRIQRFTEEGSYRGRSGSFCNMETGEGCIGEGAGQFYLPSDITITYEGQRKIVVADTFNHRIQKFRDVGSGDLTLELLSKWGSPGSGDGQFYYPRGIIERPGRGEIYIADSNNDRIQKFGFFNNFISKWGGGSDDGEFNDPTAITIDNDNTIYVADTMHHRIQKFDLNGTYVGKWGRNGGDGTSGSGNGEFNRPQGIAVDGSGSVYVADTDNHRIQKFNTSGQYSDQWGSNGNGDSEFDNSQGIAVDSSGDVYVADSGNHRIQKFSSDGVLIGWWGKDDLSFTGWHNPGSGNYAISGAGNGAFNNPRGVTVDASDNIYVADTDNHRIQKFSSDGTFVSTWGSECTLESGAGCIDPDGGGPRELGEGQFSYPVGIAFDESGYVYVSDSGNSRVQQFTLTGTFVMSWGSYEISPEQLNEPLGLAVNTQGWVYVAEAGINRIQVFKEVIVADNPRAIIVAGRAFPSESLWDATRQCTNFAYDALTYRGFDKEEIYYLSADTGYDHDKNGLADDVDDTPTLLSLPHAITEWAVNEDADTLVLYLNDHGGPDTFRLHEGIDGVLSASDLDSWLDDFQTSTSGSVIVIYEACESGSFVDDLQGNDRIIITSTLPGEQAKFLTQGTISFSNFFWTHIFNGLSIEESYLNATEIVNFAFSNQNPQINGDAENIHLGSGASDLIGEAPVIEGVSGPQEITGTGTSAPLYADVAPDPDGIDRVWAVIWRPDYVPGLSEDPLLSLPTVEFSDNDLDGHYEATYNEFDINGTYQIAIYAIDGMRNPSIPQITTLSRNYNVERRAIVIAGGSSETVERSMIETNAGIAYDALKAQLFTDDDIYFMSVTFFRTEVDEGLLMNANANLQSHLTSLATDSGIENLDLTLYLIGAGDTGTFTMNEDMTPDILLASNLDTRLDSLQTAKPGRVTIVYDGDKSGSFITPLIATPPPDERIVLTSTGADAPAYFSGAGDTCFSSFFWGQVAGGATLYNAFAHARQALKYLSRKEEISFSCYDPQSPLIDANGNAAPNEEEDYQIARSRTIGIGMKFADDPPQIGSASIEEDGVVTIVAEGISTTTELQRVWAVIKPIDFCPDDPGSETGELEEVDLTDPDEDGRYEGIYSDPVDCYKVSVYAMDMDGNTSLPKETKIYQEGGDIYEPDEYRADANVIVPGHPTGQPHTSHYDLDEDWVKFYGLNGQYYTIEADNLGSESEPVIELYYEEDGIPVAMESTIINNKVSIDLECLEDGVYYVHLSNSVSGTDTGYELTVYYPYIEDLVPVAGRVEESGTLDPIDGATITTGGIGSGISVGGEYEMYETPGTWNMDAYAYGYESYTGSLQVGLGIEFITKDIQMGSAALADYDNDGVADDDDNCPYHSNTGQGDGDGDGIGDACEADKGNVDGTGGVGLNDIQAIINIFLLHHTPTGYEYWAADVNNDGRINVSDVQRAINMLL